MFYPILSSRIWYFWGSKINIFDSHRKHQTPAAILALSRFCFMALRTGKVGRWEGKTVIYLDLIVTYIDGTPERKTSLGSISKSWMTKCCFLIHFFANNYNNWCIFNPLLFGGFFLKRWFFPLRFGHLFPSPGRNTTKKQTDSTTNGGFSRHGQGEGGCERRGQGRS